MTVLLRCDLTRLPTDATPDLFAPHISAPQFRLGEITIALQWADRFHADTLVGGRDQIGLARFEAMPPEPGAKGSWRCWIETVALGRRRIGGRLVRYRHVWRSDIFAAKALPAADQAMGAHHYGLNWPIDRGGGVLQIELVRPGMRDAPIPPAQIDEILAAFTIAPTPPGHIVASDARISGDVLEISVTTLPKITRDWGTINPCRFTGGYVFWDIRLSGLGKAQSLPISPRGVTLEQKLASLTDFADRWDAALTRLPELLARGVARLIEELAGYGEDVSAPAVIDHFLRFDTAPPGEDDDPGTDLRLISDVHGRDSDDIEIYSGTIEIDQTCKIVTRAE
ncbi:MAG: hypothetical protein Q4G26_05330 [Paracoccus sp. (in: a-proteobacteria)]|nr:hypothetical protein [Paracoccus sp. (in: a-proteobacteria)]